MHTCLGAWLHFFFSSPTACMHALCTLRIPTNMTASLAGQTFAARGGEGGAREGGKRTSGHFRQVFVDVAGMLALPIRLESVQ